jgi:hypothetical protein
MHSFKKTVLLDNDIATAPEKSNPVPHLEDDAILMPPSHELEHEGEHASDLFSSETTNNPGKADLPHSHSEPSIYVVPRKLNFDEGKGACGDSNYMNYN